MSETNAERAACLAQDAIEKYTIEKYTIGILGGTATYWGVVDEVANLIRQALDEAEERGRQEGLLQAATDFAYAEF